MSRRNEGGDDSPTVFSHTISNGSRQRLQRIADVAGKCASSCLAGERQRAQADDFQSRSSASITDRRRRRRRPAITCNRRSATRTKTAAIDATTIRLSCASRSSSRHRNSQTIICRNESTNTKPAMQMQPSFRPRQQAATSAVRAKSVYIRVKFQRRRFSA